MVCGPGVRRVSRGRTARARGVPHPLPPWGEGVPVHGFPPPPPPPRPPLRPAVSQPWARPRQGSPGRRLPPPPGAWRHSPPRGLVPALPHSLSPWGGGLVHGFPPPSSPPPCVIPIRGGHRLRPQEQPGPPAFGVPHTLPPWGGGLVHRFPPLPLLPGPPSRPAPAHPAPPGTWERRGRPSPPLPSCAGRVASRALLPVPWHGRRSGGRSATATMIRIRVRS